MRIVCAGGGPAGLYFALLMKKLHPAHSISVVERNRAYDTFGWGVVFSDATMQSCAPGTRKVPRRSKTHSTIGTISRCCSRERAAHQRARLRRHRPQELLNILQRRCEALGVELVFERDVDPIWSFRMRIW